jgi:hypothetical protein
MTDANRTRNQVSDRRPHRTALRARCRAWLRELSNRLAWMLIARHRLRQSYCPNYRNSLAILLRGLDRDVALSLLCEPVHCYAHAAGLAWESVATVKRSPLLMR